jgi:SPOR domain
MSEPIVKRRPMIDLEEFERRLRKPLAANPGDDDPLAELARFVGEPGDPYKEDPYKTMFEPLSRRPAGMLWHGEGEERGAHEALIGGDFAAIEAGLLGAARHESGENLSLSEEVDGCEEAEGAEHWRYPDTAEGSREAGPPYNEEIRSRGPLYVMAAVIVAGLAGIGASFGFKGASSPADEIATIRPADGPAKIHPETAAGTEIPGQDTSILGGSPQKPPVAVVNNAEQPADLSAQANVPDAQEANPPRAIAGLATGAASVPVPAPPAQVQPQPSAGPLSIADLIEPKKVKTVSVRPDGTLLPNDAPPQVAAPTVPVPVPVTRPATAAKAATPKSAARVATTPKPAADANGNPQPPRTSVADARGQTPVAGAPQAVPGSFSVQLAAPGTEQEARATEVRLMQKFGAEFAGFHTSIHKAAVGGKPVYRVRLGGFPSRDEATALCQKVQSGGGNCFVAKN